MAGSCHRRRSWPGALIAFLLSITSPAAAQTARSLDPNVIYILPMFLAYQSTSDENFAEQVRQLRARIGEGRNVHVGFTVYISIAMTDWSIDTSDPQAVRAALAGTIDQIDRAIDRARAHGIPICLSFLTAIRGQYDPAKTRSEEEDIRNMQWYSDNVVARGWWSHSQYARKQYHLQEAYVRELGRVLANRIASFPDTIVAASGDGEVELSYERATAWETAVFADYSPFTIAEFRDWLRQGGLYGPGEPLADQSYDGSLRYAGDASPNSDTNGDGHTLNGDFGTSFSSWELRYFNWNLSDSVSADPNAIPLASYQTSDWNRMSDAGASLFDAPRDRVPAAAWWNVWDTFRQTTIWRHNQNFARWMTTSRDAGTGVVVPNDRWFSDQIPADYLFGHTPTNPDLRFVSSASPWWTADVSPYGSLGLTSFNLNLDGTNFAQTLTPLAPTLAQRDRRWALLEWNPSVPVSADLAIYRREMRTVEQYGPAVLVPFAWDHPNYPFQDTGFEVALRELVDRIKDGHAAAPAMSIDLPTPGRTSAQPFIMAGWALDAGVVRGPGHGPGVDTIHVYAYPNPGSGASPVFVGVASYGGVRSDVGAAFGSSQFSNVGFSLVVSGLTPGIYQLVAYARSTVTGTFNNAAAVTVTVRANPLMSIDTPRPGDTPGRFTIAGWAIDLAASTGTGVDTLHLYAYPDPGSGRDPISLGVATYGAARPDVGAIFGSQFANSGFGLVAQGLAPGAYQLVLYSHSTLSHTFSNVAAVTVRVISGARMNVDTPSPHATVSQPFLIGGWALDLGATSGSGVDVLHVYAYPNPGSGQPPAFIGAIPTGGLRPDLEPVFGPQFTSAGFNFVVSGLSSGRYQIVVYAHNAATGLFDDVRAFEISVQ